MTRRGNSFTLVEIMIVVAIIGLLAAIAIPTFATARRSAWKNMCITNLRQIQAAQAQVAFSLSEGESVDQASVNKYLKNPDPTCPASAEPYDLSKMPPECPSIATFPDHVLLH